MFREVHAEDVNLLSGVLRGATKKTRVCRGTSAEIVVNCAEVVIRISHLNLDHRSLISPLLGQCAKICKLQELRVTDASGCSEVALTSLAAHCHALQLLSFGGRFTPSLTSTVLRVLAVGCPKLVSLHSLAWCVTSFDAVEASRVLFARLLSLDLDISCESASTFVLL